MLQAIRNRYIEILATVYIYNEYQAYIGLERLLSAVRQKFPNEREFIAAVAKHVDDEHKHYLMFKHYFQGTGKMPYMVDRTYGYVDQFIQIIFKHPLEELNTAEILENDVLFYRVCRLIMMTEFRGIKQADAVLRSPIVRRNPQLVKIFHVIEHDEPSHCLPYQHWLRSRGSAEPGLQERITDWWVHYSLMLVKLPLLFMNIGLKRRTEFHDESQMSGV